MRITARKPTLVGAMALVGAAAVGASLAPAVAAGSNTGRHAPATQSMASDSSRAMANKLAAARVATAKYVTNLRLAKKDGYQIITQEVPGMGYHYLNPNISGFDVRKPAILVYEHTSKGMQLAALEWVFPSIPAKPTLPHATYGFFPAACHYKDGTFTPAAAQSDCPAKSPSSGSAFNFWHPPLYTMHVWVWYPNPDGLYSSTNRMVDPFDKG